MLRLLLSTLWLLLLGQLLVPVLLLHPTTGTAGPLLLLLLLAGAFP
jgi:hypothetical protein